MLTDDHCGSDEPPPGHLLGLRIDVDTHDGMRDGVPALLATLAAEGARGTFFLSMGPDRSGRAVLNLMRPGFLAKMRRTRAAALYGWRTVVSGTLLPSRPIATAFPDIARRIVAQGHEAGVHAWDHRTWQDRLDRLQPREIAAQLDRGREAFARVFGALPTSFAAPAWYSNEVALLHQEGFGLELASDCRGEEPFVPRVGGRTLTTPQVPTTLPTLDEALGDTHHCAGDYFEAMLATAMLAPWPVLTVHAETEGGPFAGDFAAFLAAARKAEVSVVPLRELLLARRASGEPLPERAMGYGTVPGRHGRVFLPA